MFDKNARAISEILPKFFKQHCGTLWLEPIQGWQAGNAPEWELEKIAFTMFTESFINLFYEAR